MKPGRSVRRVYPVHRPAGNRSGLARMTAAAAPVMYGPDGMRLFLVAAPAAIIAALLAASNEREHEPGREGSRAGPAGEHARYPGRMAPRLPAQAPRVRAGEREAVLTASYRIVIRGEPAAEDAARPRSKLKGRTLTSVSVATCQPCPDPPGHTRA